MPLLKYYCDYCEKQFQDTPAARKRHLQGVQHQRAKAIYYQNSSSSFLPDANHQMHPESFGKGVCNRFLRTLRCPGQLTRTLTNPGAQSTNPGAQSHRPLAWSSIKFGAIDSTCDVLDLRS